MKTNLLLAGFLLAAAAAPAATLYVDAASTNAVPPYTNWLTAAAVIQDAVDAAAPGDEVVVTNGVYASGGRPLNGYALTNRVCVDRAITLRSVNGPDLTVIQGYQVPGTTNGPEAVRCVYMTDWSTLAGFTLTNGATQKTGDPLYDESGGGVFCISTTVVVTNCVITGNWAQELGGGCRGGTLNHCTLMRNWARSHGGGVYGSVLNDCSLIGNTTAFGSGGGACFSTHNNCVLTGNQAPRGPGGGAYRGVLNNCTVAGNHSFNGGGVANALVNNCIVYFNTMTPGTNALNYTTGTFNNCCTTPMPTNGTGNITNEPVFVDLAGGNLRLQAGSPCINAGNNTYVSGSTDLDGRPRIVGASVDMGAYEFQDEFTNWLAQFSLPTDGTADFTDPDGDRFNSYQEYRCATNPTNALSFLRLLPPAPAGTNVTLTWPSATGRSYALECSTNLFATPPFFPLATNLPGQPGTTSFTVTNGAAWGPSFYRVFVP